jgi:DNA primase
MPGRIRQEDIEAVRERIDLAKVVSGYLTLKKAGHDSLVGICPFHPEKTASFSVSPSKGVFYCFGCGEGGDAIAFLRKVENLTFPEAVERLAPEAGVTLRYEAESPGERRAASRREALHKANAEAAALYHRTLMESPDANDARAYLASRGIDRDVAERFGVGYAPASSNFLLRSLAKTISPELLLEAGLAVRDAEGGVRDRFRDRIAFPINDLSGRAIGFGARLIKDVEGQPKYLNTRETPVYDKGNVLYNLDRAKPGLARNGDAYVVEGYTDVIALYQAGVDTAVATCGTALGESHFRLMARFARRVILSFDSDEAGARAAERAYAIHQNYPLEVRVLVLPDGLDPADFVRARGADEFRQVAKEALPLIQFMLDRSLDQADLVSVDGRTRAAAAATPLLEGVQDPVAREQYVHYVADRVGVSDAAMVAKLGSGTRQAATGPASTQEETDAPPRKLTPQHRVEWEMLKLMARSTDINDTFSPKLTEEHFDRAQHRKLFQILRDAGGDVRSVLAGLPDDDKMAAPLAALATEPLMGETTNDYAERIFLDVKESELKRRIEGVRNDLQRLNPIKDQPQYDERFAVLAELEGERRRVRAQAERV